MAVTLDRLRAFLEAREVWVPKDASREYLEATVVRHHLHEAKREVDLGRCFGFWQDEDFTCLTCPVQAACFRASVGMERTEYLARFERHRKRSRKEPEL